MNVTDVDYLTSLKSIAIVAIMLTTAGGAGILTGTLSANASVQGQDSPILEEEPNDDLSSAMPIKDGDNITGEVKENETTDTFAINVQEGETVVAKFLAPEGEITPHLIGPDGEDIDYISAVGYNFVGHLNKTASQTGTYYIQVLNERAWSPSSGQYFVRVNIEERSEALTETENDPQSSTSERLPNTLTIRSTGDERAYYTVTVSDSIAPGPGADFENAKQPDEISVATATGSTAQGGIDNFTFSGDLTALDLEGGPAAVYVNGEQVDPADYQSTSTSTPTLTPTPTATTTPTPTPIQISTATSTQTSTAPATSSRPVTPTPTASPSSSATSTLATSPTDEPTATESLTTSPTGTAATSASDQNQGGLQPTATTQSDGSGRSDGVGPGFGVSLTVIVVIAAALTRLLVARRRE